MPLTVLELFAGIGGCAFALGQRGQVVLAVDQDSAARATYQRQHPGTPLSPFNLHQAPVSWFENLEASLWWMSPPCQPYTIRGHQRDLADRRSQAFVRVCAAIAALTPDAVALENVPWFKGSEGEALLLDTLERAGYDVHTEILCPTQLGLPAERRRYYLVGSRSGLVCTPSPAPQVHGAILDWLLPEAPPHLDVSEDLRSRYQHALHIVDAEDPEAVAVCFTGAYGNSPVHAGSYLRHQGRLRRFAPQEIAASLGHPIFDPPPGTSERKQYKLIGNSLSVPAVRHLLARLPALSSNQQPSPAAGPPIERGSDQAPSGG